MEIILGEIEIGPGDLASALLYGKPDPLGARRSFFGLHWPHTFDIGKEAVARYFKVTEECAQAQRLKVMAQNK